MAASMLDDSVSPPADPLFAGALAEVFRAALFAAEKHRHQRRKDAEASPYINHPLQVAYILAREGGITDGVTLAAALLHDTLEDTATTREELEEQFGPEIAAVVQEVSDDKALSPKERKRMQIEHAPHLSPAAKLVKLADKIANLHDLIHHPPAGWPLDRKREYFDWAKAVVDALGTVSEPLEALFAAVFKGRPG